MIMSGANVGGNLSGQQTSFSAMGSSTNQQWNINGAVISDIASGNSSPTYYDFDSFEEIQITTAGADASQQGAGVQVNFITRSGSNKFTGFGRFYNTNDKCFGKFGSCQAINVTDACGTSARAVAIRFRTFATPARSWAGRSRRTRRGSGARRRARTSELGVLGFYEPGQSGCPGVASTASDKMRAVRSSTRSRAFKTACSAISRSSRTTTPGSSTRSRRSTRRRSRTPTATSTAARAAATQFHPLITCSVQTGPTIFYTTDHRWIASNR